MSEEDLDRTPPPPGDDDDARMTCISEMAAMPSMVSDDCAAEALCGFSL